MREQNSRYTEFGNSIISRYCGFDTFYDPITLLFPRIFTETEESEKQPQYTNIYQLWYLKEENHIYEKKLTFLTNLLGKNIQGQAAFSIEQQVKRVIHDRLPQLENSIVKQITNETVDLLRYEKNENRREEVTIRLLEEKYQIEREAAEKLYINLEEKTRTYLKRRKTLGRNPVSISNRSEWNQIQWLKENNPLEFYSRWMSRYQTINKNENSWYRNESSSYPVYLPQVNPEQTEVTEGDITENRNYTENINQIQKMRLNNPLEFYSHWMNQYHTINKNESSWYQNESFSYPAYLSHLNLEQTEITEEDTTENRSYTENIIQIQKKKMKSPLEFYSHWMSRYQTVNKNESSWHQNESLSYPVYLSQVNLEQTQVTGENVTENNSYTENINQIQYKKLKKFFEFYSNWMSQYQTVNKNERSWYQNESLSYPAYLSQVNLEQTQVTGESVTENHSYTENINQIQHNKLKNPFEFYSHWMSQYQTVNENENSWYQNGNLSYLSNLSQMNIDWKEITGRDVTESRRYTENINQIQWMKMKNPLEYYSHWMSQYHTVIKNANKNENIWYRNASSSDPAYLTQMNQEQTEITRTDFTESRRYIDNISHIQQKKTENPLEFYSNWMRENVYKTENSRYRNESSFYPAYLSQVNIEQIEMTGGNAAESRSYVENINQIQQKKTIHPLKFYSHWMNQYQTINETKNSWYRNESSSDPAYLSQLNPEQIEMTGGDVIENRSYPENINQIQQKKTKNPLEFYSHWMNQYQTVNETGNSWYRNESSSDSVYLSQLNLEQIEITGGDVIENRSYPENINQIQRMKLKNPLEFYESFTRIINPEHQNAQLKRPEASLSQVIGSGEVNLVYGSDRSSQEQEQARKDYRQVIETHKQVKKEMEFINETHYEVEQLNQTYRQWEKKQKKAEEETIRLNSEQGKRYVQQEAEKVLEKYIDGNINQITGKVYRKLEERLRTERGRRGMI